MNQSSTGCRHGNLQMRPVLTQKLALDAISYPAAIIRPAVSKPASDSLKATAARCLIDVCCTPSADLSAITLEVG